MSLGGLCTTRLRASGTSGSVHHTPSSEWSLWFCAPHASKVGCINNNQNNGEQNNNNSKAREIPHRERRKKKESGGEGRGAVRPSREGQLFCPPGNSSVVYLYHTIEVWGVGGDDVGFIQSTKAPKPNSVPGGNNLCVLRHRGEIGSYVDVQRGLGGRPPLSCGKRG